MNNGHASHDPILAVAINQMIIKTCGGHLEAGSKRMQIYVTLLTKEEGNNIIAYMAGDNA